MSHDPAAPSQDLQQRLHTVFDEQVTNHGAYNLVCASGLATHREPSVNEVQGGSQHHFVIGYRRSPSEMVIAPFRADSLLPHGLPVALDNTNTVRAERGEEGTWVVENTSGSVFRLEVAPTALVPADGAARELEQTHDVEDFLAYLAEQLPTQDLSAA